MANPISNLRIEEERSLQQVSILPPRQDLPPGQDWYLWKQHIPRNEV